MFNERQSEAHETSYHALEKQAKQMRALMPVINTYDDYGYIGWLALYHSCMQQAECIHTWSGVTSLSDTWAYTYAEVGGCH